MGTPFAGYVRDPSTVSDSPSDATVRAAISDASREYGVPEDVMTFVWNVEAGGQANAYQEVGVNSGGYGGFYGLPSRLIGDTRAQTRTTAGLLATYHAQTGSWASAMNIYNTGQPDQGYGSQYESGAVLTRTTAPAPAQLVSADKSAADSAATAAASDPGMQLPTIAFPTLPNPHVTERVQGAVADRVVPVMFVIAFLVLVVVVIAESV